MGCFLEFLYTGDYFPKKVPGQRALEKDPSIPEVDLTGEQLLKHARVYTIAEKFGLTNLKNLASSKIHCVNSTAKGEIAYARYVYEFTSKDDTTIRAPVANFWATRSHTLRAEAEDEFRNLCLEFPQFGYDVLSTFCPVVVVVVDATSLGGMKADKRKKQPASSTRSSSASATKRCTPVLAALASAPDTAARLKRRRELSSSSEAWNLLSISSSAKWWRISFDGRTTHRREHGGRGREKKKSERVWFIITTHRQTDRQTHTKTKSGCRDKRNSQWRRRWRWRR